MLSPEDVQLSLGLNSHLSASELRKHAIKLRNQTSSGVAKLLNQLVKSKNPHEVLEDLLSITDRDFKVLEYSTTVGVYGAIFVEGEVFPATLEVGSPDDLVWARQNEATISLRLAQSMMNRLNRNALMCQVMLFANHGFSGKTVPWNIERDTTPTKEVKDVE